MRGRKKHPWGKQIGLTPNTVGRLCNGENVGSDVLTTVARCENVSLTWLIEGKGEPFIVHRMETDEEAADYVAMLMADEPGWTVHHVFPPKGEPWAVVLTQPGQFQRGDADWIAYTIVEVVVGALGDKTRSALASPAEHQGMEYHEVADDIIEDLRRGRLGTFALVGDKNQPGILSSSRTGYWKPADYLAEESGQYRPIDGEAREVAKKWQDLPEHKKAAILALLDITREESA